MLTFRRISIIYQYIYPLSSYQYRFESKKTIDDKTRTKSTHFNKELLDFERKTSKTSQNLFKNRQHSTNDDRIQKKQLSARKWFSFSF